jgi:hypothetical protein
MEKRNLMNLLLLGAIGLPTAGLAGPFVLFFAPPRYTNVVVSSISDASYSGDV